MVRVFDVGAMRIRKKHYSIAGVCRKEFFYTVETGVQDESSEYFEEVFGRIETMFSEALPGIINRAGTQELTNNDLYHLAYFMTVQWMRTPSFREFVQITNLDNSTHLNLIDKEKVNGFCNLLLAKKWQIFLSEGPYYFITSDNPLVDWRPPMTGLIPVTFMDGSHLFALTPKILIWTTPPDNMDSEQQPVHRLNYYTATGNSTFLFNTVIAYHVHQYAYAPRTGEFKRLLRAFTSSDSSRN